MIFFFLFLVCCIVAEFSRQLFDEKAKKLCKAYLFGNWLKSFLKTKTLFIHLQCVKLLRFSKQNKNYAEKRNLLKCLKGCYFLTRGL